MAQHGDFDLCLGELRCHIDRPPDVSEEHIACMGGERIGGLVHTTG